MTASDRSDAEPAAHDVESAARRILGDRLGEARWSASKGRPLASVALVDAAWLSGRGGGRHVLAIGRATFADGGPGESYLLPLVAGGGGLREAGPGDRTWAAVADAVTAGLTVRGAHGVFTFEAEPGAAPGLVSPAPAGTPRPRAAMARPRSTTGGAARSGRASPVPDEREVGDQTHSSAVVEGRAVVKLRRRLGPAGSRELAVGRLLGGPHPFDGAPALLGSAVHRDPDGTVTVLAVVHAFVPDARDGYEATNAAIRAWLATPGAAGLRASTDAAAALGRLTARLHLHFAGRGEGGGPGTATTAASPAVRRALCAAGDRALADAIDAARASGSARGDRLAAHLVGIAPRVMARLALLDEVDVLIAGSLGHGDLHLGQTLVTADGRWLAIDFEGEPVGAAADGTGGEPPAVRDVAGMLRSFDHVARSAMRRAAAERSDDPALDPESDPIGLLAALPGDLRSAADRWVVEARSRYLAAYRTTGGDELRRSAGARAVHALEVQKECYELAYAARVLPSWAWAPVGGMGWLLAHPPRHPAAAGPSGDRRGTRRAVG